MDKQYNVRVKYTPEIDEASLGKAKSKLKIDGATVKIDFDAGELQKSMTKLKGEFEANRQFIKETNAELKAGKTLTEDQEKAYRKAKEEVVSQKKAITDIKDQLRQASDNAKGMGDSFEKAGLSFDGITGKIAKIGLAISGIQQISGVFDQFLTPYKEFDKQLKNIGTLGVQNFEEFRNAAIDLASGVPDTVAGVTEGVYNAISAGAIKVVDGVADVAGGMKFLEQSSKLAVAGLTDTNSAVKSLSSVTNAYGPEVLSAAQASDILFSTVKNGVTTIPELNASLSNVVPIAAAAGVSFEQVGAAIATMTKQGVPTAQATTQIRAAIAELMKPGANLKKVMEEAGVSMASLKQDGLQATMAKLGEAMNSMGTDSANTFSSIEAISFALASTGDNALKAAGDLEAIKAGAGSVEEAFAIANAGIGVQVQGVLNQIEAVAFKAFGTMGDGAVMAVDALNKIAPTAMGLASIGQILPLASVKQFSLTILKTLIPSLVSANAATGALTLNTQALSMANFKELGSTIASMVATAAKTVATWAATAATWAATAAQWAWNAAMNANPLGLLVAGIAAAIGAVALLANALSESTAERAENLKQEQELLDKQMQTNEAQQSKLKQQELLIQQYQALGEKTSRTADEEERYRDVQLELSKTFPGVISGSASFAENLANVKKKSEEGQASLAKLKDEFAKLELKKVSLKVEVEKNNAQQVVEDMQDVVSSFWEGTDFRAKKGMEDYIKAMKEASSSADLESIASDFKLAIFNDKSFAGLDAEERNQMVELAGKLQESLSDGLAANSEKAELAVRNLVSDAMEKGAEISPEALAKIANETNKPIEEIQNMFDKAKDVAQDNKMGDLIAEAFKIDKEIDNTSALDALVQTYEDAQKRIDELKAKQGSTGGMTTAEQAEFDALSKKAKETADSIAAIVPASKANIKLVADDSGKLVEVYDLNIAKVKEFTAEKNASLSKSPQQEEYMKMLKSQVSAIDDQKAKQIELKKQIDATADPTQQQKLTDEYNKQNEVILKNSSDLVDGFSKGSQAGLVTADSINILAKALGVSSEEAQKMLVAKALEDAAKAGELTEEQVAKIADKFGYSKEKAMELKKVQEQNTAEAKATAAAAKSIGEQYAENKKKAEEKHTGEKTELIGLINLEKEYAREGKTLSAEQVARKKELQSELGKITKELKAQNKIESDINKIYDTSYKVESAEKTKKLVLTAYQIDKERLSVAYQQSEATMEKYRIEVGLQKTAYDDLVSAQDKLAVYNKQKAAVEAIIKAYGGKLDENNQVIGSSFDKDQKAEVQKEIDSLIKDINKQIESIDTIAIKADVDRSKADDTIAKLQDDTSKKKLSIQLEVGTITKAEYDKGMFDTAKAELVSLQEEMSKLEQILRIADPIQKATIEKEIATIGEAMTKKNKEIAGFQADLLESTTLAELRATKDKSERERKLRLFELAKTYDAQMKAARGNKDEELRLIDEFARKESEINNEYAYKNMSFKTKALMTFTTAMQSALSNIVISDNSANITKAKEQVDAIDGQIDKLDSSFKSGEESYANYINNLNKLDSERVSAHKEATKQSINLVGTLNKALSQSFGALATSSAENISKLTERYQVVTQDMGVIREKLKTTFDPNELSAMYDSLAVKTEESAGIMSDAWMNFGTNVGSVFSQMLAEGNSFLKSTVVATLGALKAIIPIYIAQIYAKEIAEKSFWGIATAVGLTTILTGLVATAEAAVKSMHFKDGGAIPLGERLITVNEVGQEFVMNHVAYSKNREAFQDINKRNITIEQYANERKLIEVDKSMKLDMSGLERRLERVETATKQVRDAVHSSILRNESHIEMEFNDKELVSRYHISRANKVRSF